MGPYQPTNPYPFRFAMANHFVHRWHGKGVLSAKQDFGSYPLLYSIHMIGGVFSTEGTSPCCH